MARLSGIDMVAHVRWVIGNDIGEAVLLSVDSSASLGRLRGIHLIAQPNGASDPITPI